MDCPSSNNLLALSNLYAHFVAVMNLQQFVYKTLVQEHKYLSFCFFELDPYTVRLYPVFAKSTVQEYFTHIGASPLPMKDCKNKARSVAGRDF